MCFTFQCIFWQINWNGKWKLCPSKIYVICFISSFFYFFWGHVCCYDHRTYVVPSSAIVWPLVHWRWCFDIVLFFILHGLLLLVGTLVAMLLYVVKAWAFLIFIFNLCHILCEDSFLHSLVFCSIIKYGLKENYLLASLI